MFYNFARLVLHWYLFVFLGPIKINGKENIPLNHPFILVAPHHHWWDSLLFAVYLKPVIFFFMAKQELFKNAIFAKILSHLNAFPINRNSASIATIKITINHLKKQPESLIIFPTGSRYSNTLKSGYLLISQKSGCPIVPVVFKRSRWGSGYIYVDKPYIIEKKEALNALNQKKYNKQLTIKFSKLLQKK